VLPLQQGTSNHNNHHKPPPRQATARTILAAAVSDVDRGVDIDTNVDTNVDTKEEHKHDTNATTIATKGTNIKCDDNDDDNESDDYNESDNDQERLLLMNPMEFFDQRENEEDRDGSNDASSTAAAAITATTTNNNDSVDDDDDDSVYKKGLATVGFITFLFATNSPVLHGAFSGDNPPPVVLVNAAVSLVALVGLLLSGSDSNTDSNQSGRGNALDDGSDADAAPQQGPTKSSSSKSSSSPSLLLLGGGLELGTYKFLGTTFNLYGLALTTASHGALLIQLTTLIVPTVRGIVYKERIPTKVKASIVLALAGVLLFSQDGVMVAASPLTATTTVVEAATATVVEAVSTISSSGIDIDIDIDIDGGSGVNVIHTNAINTRLVGDGLCVLAAVCYSAYDLRLYEYGKVIVNNNNGNDNDNDNDEAKTLITNKIAVQAVLSLLLLCLAPSLTGIGGGGGATTGSSSVSSWQESSDYVRQFLGSDETMSSSSSWIPVAAAVVWSGVAVNAVAPFLQVRGQQIVGPTKCQTIYASQPLWAAALSFLFLGETLGWYGITGGGAFLVALALAATATNTTTNTGEEANTNNATNDNDSNGSANAMAVVIETDQEDAVLVSNNNTTTTTTTDATRGAGFEKEISYR